MNTTDRRMIFISLTDEPNGAENVLLMAATAAKGSLVFLKKSSGAALQIADHLPRRYLSHKSISGGILKLISLVKEFKKDEIIMSTHPYLNALLGFLKRMGYLKPSLITRECTSVFTRFTGLKKLVYRIIYRVGYPGINLMICQTELMKAQLLQYNRFISPLKVIVLSNPVDFEKISALSKKPLVNDDAKLDYICSAGRLIPEKDFSTLIEAFKIVKKEHPKLKLLVLGEGGERAMLTQLIEKNELKNEVILKGYIENPAPYFKNAKLCVISSVKEGFPNVLLEMMTVNDAIVTTLCAGGINEIPAITKVEVSNPSALGNAINKTLSNANSQDREIRISYLNQRNPMVFTNAVLNALHNQISA